MSIKIKPSPTADTRTCDYSKVTLEQLRASSEQHIEDVRLGLDFFRELLATASERHDFDKLSAISEFHSDFITGFKTTGWWDNHRKVNRHHLLSADGIPADVDLIDVLEMIADCVMAGMARAGSVYSLDISSELLMRAFQNTTELLKGQIKVEAGGKP